LRFPQAADRSASVGRARQGRSLFVALSGWRDPVRVSEWSGMGASRPGAPQRFELPPAARWRL